MKKVIFLFFAVLLFSFPLTANAQVILDDDFNNTTLVNMTKTNAIVDTANSCVRLPKQKMPNAIAMLKYGEGYAVTATDGVTISEYDAATGVLNDTKVPWLTNTRGLAIRQDNMNLWVIGDDYVQYCQFSGGAYTDDPALKSSGMTEVLSVGAIEGTDQAVVLSKSVNGKVRITRYRAGATLTVELDEELDIDEPRALSVVDGTPDIVIASKTGKHYLMFDDATQDYVEDVAKKASGLTDVASVSANEYGVALLDNGNGKYLQDNDVGGSQHVLAYSTGSVPGAVALSVKPGAYDQAILTEDGEVRYYCYDDATDSLKRVTDMEKTGIQLAGGYVHPKEYWSKAISTSEVFDEIRLTAEEDMPVGTNIKYYVSSDGGVSFTEVINGEWKTVPAGNNFVIKAILDTMDKNQTPKLLRITLENTALILVDLIIRGIAYNDPGQPTPVIAFPAKVKAGAEIQFQVETSGYAERVWAQFSDGRTSEMTPLNPITSDSNIWRGLYNVAADTDEGTIIWATLTAQRGAKEKHLTQNPFILVQGKVSQEVDLILTQ